MDVLVTAVTSPSALARVAPDVEAEYRRFACDLVHEGVTLLRLPQPVLITAQAIVQRFFFAQSLTSYDAPQVAMAAVFLASKVEECTRRSQDVVAVFQRIKHLRAQTLAAADSTISAAAGLFVEDTSAAAVDSWRGVLFLTEAVVLKELGYDMLALTCHPHRFVLYYCELLRCPADVIQDAWSYANDLHRLQECTRHPPETLACAALLSAATKHNYPLPLNPPWYQLMCPLTPASTLEALAAAVTGMYTRPVLHWLPSLRRD